ncbi:hypothetical protein M9458_007481, partial [Cirrhinus mrigala]
MSYKIKYKQRHFRLCVPLCPRHGRIPHRGHHPAWHISCLEMLAMFQASRIRRILTPMALLGQSGVHRIPRSACQPGVPLQGTELAVHTNPEAGLERLVPLVDYLAPWKLLPNVSAWVLRTVERGYRIKFGAPPPHFNGVFPTVVSPEQGLVMEQEVDTLLRKEAIEVVPPHDRESGFYSRYFIIPKKDGGLRPFFRSEAAETLSHVAEVQNADCQSEDWFVTIDLKDAYFHVSILPQHRKGEAYQYRVLPVGLALSPRTFTKCVDAALAPLRLRGIRILDYIDDWLILAQSEHMAMKEMGLRLNAKKSVLLSPARIESILTAVTRVKEDWSLTVKQFQRLLGLMAAASNVIPFGLLYMRLLQWWLRIKRFSLRGNPFLNIKARGDAYVPWTCRGSL